MILSRRPTSGTAPGAPGDDRAPACGDTAAPPSGGDPDRLVVEVLDGVATVDAAAWDHCAGTGHPFVTHAFLSALELSGSATSRTGWAPRPLAVRAGDGRLQAVLPLYLKGHSWGEYVFDHAWANAWQQAGGEYYPKALAAVPFTPATGPRLLVAPEGDRPRLRQALIAGIEALTVQNDLSSAHVLFLPEDDVAAFRQAGWLIREGVQFHWHNQGYRSFDDFLAALSSRKRKNIRKERDQVRAAGLTLRRLTGDDLKPEHWDRFYAFYRDTVDKRWGSAYLKRGFFARVHETLRDHVVLVLAYDPHGDMIAGALNFAGATTLYGRNWGCLAEYKMLHFEACYYQAIEHAIETGLERVEAGAQGHHKIARGYLPTRTYSAHFIPHAGFRDAVARFLAVETREMEHEIQGLMTESPYRRAGDC